MEKRREIERSANQKATVTGPSPRDVSKVTSERTLSERCNNILLKIAKKRRCQRMLPKIVTAKECVPPFPSLLFYTAPIVPPISIQKTMFLCPLLLSLSRTFFFFQSSDLYFLWIFSLTVLKILHGANFKVCSRSFEQISINDTI